MRPTSLDRFRVNSPRPAYEANVHNVNEGVYNLMTQIKSIAKFDSNFFLCVLF